MKRFAPLLAAALVALAAAPAAAANVKDDQYGALEAQLMPQGFVAGANYFIRIDSLEFDSRIVCLPTNFTRFFMGEAAFKFTPVLTDMIPVDIRPIVGLAGGMYIDETVAPAGGTGMANAYIALPIGARFTMPLSKSLVVSVEGLYNYELAQILPTQLGYSVARTHVEAAARMGALAGAVYYDAGKNWSGPGVRVGMNF